jgi:hypothetical protein
MTSRLREEEEALERAARLRDPRWDSDPPVNRSLYYDGWEDARDYYLAALTTVQGEKRAETRIAHDQICLLAGQRDALAEALREIAEHVKARSPIAARTDLTPLNIAIRALSQLEKK